MEWGSIADWFSGIITATGIGISVYIARKTGDLNIEFKTTLSTNRAFFTSALGVKEALKFFITNHSPVKIEVIQTGFFYKTSWYGKRNQEITLSVGHNIFDESGAELSYGETKHSSFSYSDANIFPKDNMIIWVYPYILLKTGRFIVSKRGFKVNVSRFGYSHRVSEKSTKQK